MKTKSLVLLPLLLLIFSSCGSNSSQSSTTDTNTDQLEEPSKPEEPEPNWTYTDSEDKMSGTKSYFATTTSTNEIEFEFPYDGGTRMQVIVRNMGKGNEVVVLINKGQFIGSLGGEYNLRVKFDEGAPSFYSYNDAADGSSEVLFVNNSSKFISNLKKSKKMMLEAPFYDAGTQIFEFNTEGLDWSR